MSGPVNRDFILKWLCLPHVHMVNECQEKSKFDFKYLNKIRTMPVMSGSHRTEETTNPKAM